MQTNYNLLKFLKRGGRLLNDPEYKKTKALIKLEINKDPKRTQVLNYLLAYLDRETKYLEIGTRNTEDNFNHILADTKYSVDPGFEFTDDSIDFKMTSDAFFAKLETGKILDKNITFDLIFIDGLHLAEQVEKDIANALLYIKEDGFIVLHDCNPPTEWNARENYNYKHTPAEGYWTGTTWKAFQKARYNTSLYSCCIDTDWGVGILSKTHPIGTAIKPTNPFYEYAVFARNRKKNLNLLNFEEFKKVLHDSHRT